MSQAKIDLVGPQPQLAFGKPGNRIESCRNPIPPENGMPMQQKITVTVVDRDRDGIVGQRFAPVQGVQQIGEGHRLEMPRDVRADGLDVGLVPFMERVEHQDAELPAMPNAKRGQAAHLVQDNSCCFFPEHILMKFQLTANSFCTTRLRERVHQYIG
jgi:hypothetical protein